MDDEINDSTGKSVSCSSLLGVKAFQSLSGKQYVVKTELVSNIYSIVFQPENLINEMNDRKLAQLISESLNDLKKCCDFVPIDDEIWRNLYRRSSATDSSSKILEFLQLSTTYPQIFRPYTKLKNFELYPMIVRVFDQGADVKFVMIAELFSNHLKDHKKEGPNGIFLTIDLNVVQEKFRDEIKDIEFIPIQIERAKHAAVPIVTPSGDHCILASDALLEILRRLITTLRVFYDFHNDGLQKINHFMSILESKFPSDSNCKLFINTKEVDALKAKADQSFASYSRKKSKKKPKGEKLIRDVGQFGFNVDEIKEELQYLGLHNAFPSVTDHSEAAFSEVCKTRNRQFLRTDDMCDAVELCQLLCLLEKYPNLKKFLHTQQSCHRIPIFKCGFCKLPPPVEPETDNTVGLVHYTQPVVVCQNENTVKDSEPEDEIHIVESFEHKPEEPINDIIADLEAANLKLEENIKGMRQEYSKLKESSDKELKKLVVENLKLKKEMEEQKKKLNMSASKSADETKKLKSAKETMEAQMKDANQRLTESIRFLQQKVSDLEAKSDADRLTMTLKQSYLEKELADKERMILDLQEHNTQQAAKQDKAKEELHTRISLARNQNNEHFNNILHELRPTPPQENALLLSLQKTRDTFRDNSPLVKAKQMMERLISMSSRPEIHQMAQYEYEQYEGKMSVYLQELEVSINKLKSKSPLTTHLIPSQFPSFSDRFMTEYWTEIDREKLENVKDEPNEEEDVEVEEIVEGEKMEVDVCSICLCEMSEDEETLQCVDCKKLVHITCGSDWLRVNQSCPGCRAYQVDPKEYPPLK